MKNNKNLLKSNKDPFKLFDKWFSLAKKKEINDPNAMTLSTVSKSMQPTSRLVLMKSFSKNNFIFNTNLKSKKAKNIFINSKVCLNFYWKSLRKQVRIEGIAKPLTQEESDYYFHERPRGSKIGAWASDQSNFLKNRNELIKRVKIYEKKFKNDIIPRPNNWSGFKIIPNLFEFWQDMPYRLHDRLEYKKIGNKWKIRNLYP